MKTYKLKPFLPSSSYKKGGKTLKKHKYNEKDYSSNDGMLTTIWGPSMWHYLHTMSFNYPVHPTCNDKKHYYDFVSNLKYVLPCGKCRKNLCKNFKKLPFRYKHMNSRATFSKYIYDLHEVVNNMLHKKSGLSYEDVRERYEHFRARCAKSLKKIAVKKEKGCTQSLYGEKAKCVLQIIPDNIKCDSLQIDDNCIKKELVFDENL
jgi:hypothetical protein